MRAVTKDSNKNKILSSSLMYSTTVNIFTLDAYYEFLIHTK